MPDTDPKKLRLLLVYPATHKLGWVKRFQLPSLSLKQVAAATPEGWEVVLADEVHEDVPFDGAFDLVGITAMTHQAHRAYEIADTIKFDGCQMRRDIGYRAIGRK